METRFRSSPVCVWLIAGLACAGACEDREGPSSSNRSCAAPPPPTPADVIRLQRVFPEVDADEGVALVQPRDDDTRWYLVTKRGVVYVFENRDDALPKVFVDFSDRIAEAGEAGLLDIAFHPDFGQNGELFLSYTAPGGSGAFLSRISRIRSDDGGRTADIDSEVVILEVEQPYSNHNGGDIGFGPDGYLYIGLGDGGSAGDPRDHGQDTETLLGAMLRIDVDAGVPYGIPPDNPFAAGGSRPEIFAWGLRNPWRWTFDRATGDLWLGDVGQHMWEEIDVIRRGANYGWNTMEGKDCLGTDACDAADLVEPVVQYRNTGTASVIGGYVYRGSEIPDLQGTYLFNDFYFGTMFGVRPGSSEPVPLGEGAQRISAWAEDRDGELLGVGFGGGIYRLVAGSGPTDPGADGFPLLISQTGCVDMSDPSLGALDAFPYEVNLPFWSDGADKERFLSIPAGGRIEVGDDGDFTLPVGTVLVKSFFRDGAPIETRLLVNQASGWEGYGYMWNEDATEAEFVARHREEGGWIFPEPRECKGCHTSVAGGTLGLETGQLSRAGQLEALVNNGWLAEVPAGDAFPNVGDEGVELSARARAYLHVNCSSCHRPEGPEGRARIDFRHDVPLGETGLCDQSPRAGDLGIADARILAPGEPERSVVSARMHADRSAHMPPIGTLAVDPEGVALIDAWIASLTGC